MSYELVIFDCDGVLVDSERLVNRIESEVFRGHGLPIDPETSRALFKGKTAAEVVIEIERRAGGSLPRDWAYDWGFATANALVRDLRAVPGVRAVVERLAAAGVETCVASQSPRPRVELSLAVTEMAELFADRIYCASMVARGKPAPDLFLYAARERGARPERCVVVEDSPSGVVAGRAAGMTVFGYAADEDGAELAAAGAVVFDAMEALPGLLGLA
jgi:HAD superfamily hydrolase (TIGR01509 family)